MKKKIKNWFCKLRKHPYQHKHLHYYTTTGEVGEIVYDKVKCLNCGCVYLVEGVIEMIVPID